MRLRLMKVRRRVVAGYLLATANEIAIDEYIIRSLTDRIPESTGFWPRAGRWVHISSRAPFLIYWSWVIGRLVWVAGGCVVFFLTQLIPALSRTSGSALSALKAEQEPGYVLALSCRVGDIVRPNVIGGLPKCWVTMPWAPLRQLLDGAVAIDVYALLTKRDLWHAFLEAVNATYVLFRRKRTSKWVLQSYTAFRWFVVRSAVDKLSGRLIMASHYDRWAVLVDSSVRENRISVLPSGAVQERELVLIQHGALGDLGSSVAKASNKLKLPRKLGEVSQLYVYDPAAEEAFKRDVFTEGCVRRGLQVHYFKPTIELTDFSAYSGLRLLFVGHPLCEPLHVHVFEILRSRLDFKGYYKPHPMAPMSASLKQVGWEIIEDVSKFPLVDLLIAYPSTLVVEYDGLGIPAAVHPMNLGCEDTENYMQSVFEMINSIKAKRVSQ